VRIFQFIERNFWLFLFGGLVLGLSFPAYSDRLMFLLMPLLMIMMFLVFLKTDFSHVLNEMKNYKLILYLVIVYLIVVPVSLYAAVSWFDEKIAIGILLLTAMPAAVASPAIADIVSGNTALSIGITISTSIAAPFTIPLIFGFLDFQQLSIDPWQIFWDLIIMVFVPMIASQFLRKYFAASIEKKKHFISPINMLVLSMMVYIVIGSQRESLLTFSEDLFMKLAILYSLFIVLHGLGYLLAFRQSRKNKISICIGMAYMNNGLAMVLAAKYFDPSILMLMLLSELPWDTLIVPFRKVLTHI